MPPGFIDTTVLTDYLLKKDGSETVASAAFQRFTPVIVPQFAWKEFKRGPLNHFAWAHNKLAETGSFTATLTSLQRLSRTPHRYLTSTAIEAINTAFVSAFDGVDVAALSMKYGAAAYLPKVHADALRLELRRVIITAWKARKTLFGGPHHKLPCYPDIDLVHTGERVDLRPRDCPAGQNCCLKADLVGRTADLEAARKSLVNTEQRLEVARRRATLKQIARHPNAYMGPVECQKFGDAYFVLFCPPGATVLTTNMRDIEPMALALNVPAARP